MRSDHWLNELFNTYFEMLYRLAENRLRWFGGNPADAQDVVQEVFLLANKKNIVNHPNIKGWLITATTNISRNYARANRRDQEKQRKYAQETLPKNVHTTLLFVESSDNPMDASDAKLTLEGELPSEDWELLRKYCIEGIPIDDLAEGMHISENTLRVKIHRLRNKLKKFF